MASLLSEYHMFNKQISNDGVNLRIEKVDVGSEMSPTILEVERMVPKPVEAVVYPESDGKPMADNTKQFRYIATLKGGFDALYKDRDDVFVAGDLLWYPVEGDAKTRYAPDVMIAFGRPPGDRGSYLQWRENGQPPNVVFEVMSPGNTVREMRRKWEAYERFGVEEYYVYDPDAGVFEGWLRDGETGKLEAIADTEGWESPLCGVRFGLEGAHLVVTRPDGKVFLTPSEADDALEEAIRERDSVVRERDSVLREKEVAMARAEQLAERLRALGVDPASLE